MLQAYSSHCQSCGISDTTINEEGHTSCSRCGMVTNFQQTLELSHWGNSSSAVFTKDKNPQERIGRMRENELMITIPKFLPTNLHTQCMHLLRQYTSAYGSNRFHFEPIKMGIIFTVACSHNFPVRLEQLMTKETTKRKITKAIQNIVELCGLSEFPRLKPETMMQWVVDALGVQAPMRSKLLETGKQIYELAEKCSLAEGRQSAILETAIIIVAARVLDYGKVLTLNFVATTIKMSEGTLRLRIDEIAKVFISAGQRLPWKNLITKKTFHLYVPFMLEFKEPIFADTTVEVT